MQAAAQLQPLMYATLFGLLAATGMRISEALALRLEDITVDGLMIRQTKFQKSRLLPLHETTRRALDQYLSARVRLGTLDGALLVSTTGKAPSYHTVMAIFLRLTRRSLEQCRHDREAVARHIVALSTYLGHAHVTDTYWYLHATPMLMGQIADASEALHWGPTS